jgi:ATP-binding cassette subfamily G (WHITE) protein 2
MALSVVRVLKRLVEKNKTVICTIHQPRFEIFKEFDKLMLLSRGQVVYFGTTNEAIKYFSQFGYNPDEFTNPADYYRKILNSIIFNF